MIFGQDNAENTNNGLTVMAIMASPRKNGYTAKLLGSLLREFPQGTNFDIVNLYELNPVPCNACGYCKAGNGCTKKDLEDFWVRFETADIIVFATPIYFMGVPAPFKALIDRFQRYYEARFRRNMKNPIEKHRKALLIVTSGADGEIGYEVIKHQLLQAFSVLNIELCGMTLAKNTDKCGVDSTDVDRARALYWKVR
jgi:multimeric flavodoxin WrbA